MAAFASALDHYRIDVGHYPTTDLGLNALIVRPGNEKKWNGPYLNKALPLDPWGNAYQYRSPAQKNEYEIISYGKDGMPGGTGDNADITQ